MRSPSSSRPTTRSDSSAAPWPRSRTRRWRRGSHSSSSSSMTPQLPHRQPTSPASTVPAVSVSHRQIAATRNSGGRARRRPPRLPRCRHGRQRGRRPRHPEAIEPAPVGGGCGIRFDGRLSFPHPRRHGGRCPHLPDLPPGQRLLSVCTRDAFHISRRIRRTTLRRRGGRHEPVPRKRRGRFVVLREPVTTSARKLRTFTGGTAS